MIEEKTNTTPSLQKGYQAAKGPIRDAFVAGKAAGTRSVKRRAISQLATTKAKKAIRDIFG